MAKKKKKQRKEAQKKLQNMNFNQLVEKGKENLEAGKPRDAISFFKLAGKMDGFSDEINAFLFRSYLMRETQLRQKGMLVEAETVVKQAREYMPAFKDASEDDMTAYISACPNKEAFDAYVDYIQANDRSAKVERLLANRLFISGEWDLVNTLDESMPLKRDAIPAQKAVLLMNGGEWEKALDALRPINRSSSFAPIRMFCRAMASFYREDDIDMLKALSMIPDDFPLKSVMKDLKQIGEDNDVKKGKKDSALALQCLWDGSVTKEEYAADLIQELEQERFAQANKTLCRLADAVYPQDPFEARSQILQIIWNMAEQGSFSYYQFPQMVKSLLQEDDAKIVLAKTGILHFTDPFSDVGRYLSVLENEFPDSGQRKIAYAIILHYTAKKIYEQRINLKYFSRGIGLQRNKKLLGIKSDDTEMMLLEMVMESIRLDPGNKQTYELLSELPRYSRSAKNVVETAFSSMVEHFPDDPYPCLELASVYYEKNAFRKAENILTEAMRRAPHDNRVIDRHALSLLISADKNIKREKYHLTIRDIEKAEKTGSKKAAPFIIEKRILFQLVSSKKDIKKLIEDELNSLSLTQQLRILAFLLLDIKNRDISSQKTMLETIEKIFTGRLKKANTLSSSDIMQLLIPLEKEYLSLLPFREIAPFFLRKNSKILMILNDSEIIPLFDMIFAPDLFKLIKKEIKRRIKKAAFNHRLMLDFYLAAIRHITGESMDFGLFSDIVEQAEGPLREELRTLSRRISKHASSPLKEALERFDFDMFTGGYFDDDPFDPDFDFDFDYEEEEEDIAPFENPMKALENFYEMLNELSFNSDFMDREIEKDISERFVEGIESFLDDSGFHEAPGFFIKKVRIMIRSDPEERRDFDRLANLINPRDFPELSHNARILLYGRKKG